MEASLCLWLFSGIASISNCINDPIETITRSRTTHLAKLSMLRDDLIPYIHLYPLKRTREFIRVKCMNTLLTVYQLTFNIILPQQFIFNDYYTLQRQ